MCYNCAVREIHRTNGPNDELEIYFSERKECFSIRAEKFTEWFPAETVCCEICDSIQISAVFSRDTIDICHTCENNPKQYFELYGDDVECFTECNHDNACKKLKELVIETAAPPNTPETPSS